MPWHFRQDEGKMKIRRALKSDADALVDFNLAMALETEGKELDAVILRSGVESVFSDPNKGFYVVAANGDGDIAAGLLITFEWSDWRNKWFWWIQSVYVRPEYRGRALYRNMYEFVRDQAETEGSVAGYRLYVEHDNLRAQHVYERVGMVKSHYVLYEEEK